MNDIKISSENLSIKDESFKASTEKEQNYDQNKIIPGFSQDNDSLFDDLSNNNQIIKNYKEFLNWSNKKFDKFCLCYNKEQFKAVMAEKGIKSHDNNLYRSKAQSNMKDKEKRNTKKRRTRKLDQTGHFNNKIHVDAGINPKENMKFEYSEIEFDEDDLPLEPKNENEFEKIRKKDHKPSTDIFLRF